MSGNNEKQAIANYLDAVEKAYGAEVRKTTLVEHRGEGTLFIRQGSREAQYIDMGMLYNLTNMLRTAY